MRRSSPLRRTRGTHSGALTRISEGPSERLSILTYTIQGTVTLPYVEQGEPGVCFLVVLLLCEVLGRNRGQGALGGAAPSPGCRAVSRPLRYRRVAMLGSNMCGAQSFSLCHIPVSQRPHHSFASSRITFKLCAREVKYKARGTRVRLFLAWREEVARASWIM